MVQRTSRVVLLEEIKAAIIVSEVVNADETGIFEGGRLKWLHNASTSSWTYQFAHPKRGIEAISDEKSILPQLTGVLVHDCWETYFNRIACRKH